MRKIVSIIVLVCLTLGLYAQDFDRFFENKTVRIEYKHIGNSQMEKIEVENYCVGGISLDRKSVV